MSAHSVDFCRLEIGRVRTRPLSGCVAEIVVKGHAAGCRGADAWGAPKKPREHTRRRFFQFLRSPFFALLVWHRLFAMHLTRIIFGRGFYVSFLKQMWEGTHSPTRELGLGTSWVCLKFAELHSSVRMCAVVLQIVPTIVHLAAA